MEVEIRAFGPLRVLREGHSVDLGGRLPAELLALLVHAEARAVDHEVLADHLWRGNPPASARATLQGYVARLRRVLEPGRSAREATLLVTHGDGYALEVPRSWVDVHRFVDLVEEARRVGASGPSAAAERLENALATWTGPPYAAIADIVDVAPEVARLEDLRLLAVEELAAARLALGRGAEQVPELAALAARHPLRERLQLLLARAMYAGGRQVEALDTLRSTRERMAEELGLDPSVELRDLETAILNHELEHPAPTPASASPTTGAPGFVGRESELRALAEAWQQVRAGRGSAVVVTGEPGIGKTLLVETFAAAAGVPTQWARCLQTHGVPPYWPWQQILGGLPDISDASDAGARFAFALDVVRRLRSRVEKTPGAIVIDDVQWADADSLHVLQVVLSLLDDLPLLVVLTCRDDPGLAAEVSAVLTAGARATSGKRLALTPLSADEVADLVGTVRGDASGAGLEITEIVRRSGGNPLFATELSRVEADAAEPVPALARDLVRMRVAALPPLATELVTVLSVAGREMSAGLLARAVQRPALEVDPPLAAATQAGLVVETAPGRVRVRHDLVREAVLADLGPGRRATVHARLADVLESSSGAATSLAAIAIHRSEAAAGAFDLSAADRCRVAAQEALDRAGAAEAAELALRGLGHVPLDADDLRGDLLHVRGIALRRLGFLEESTEALRSEARIARERGDHVRLAKAALACAGGGMGGYWSSVVAPSVVDVTLLEEAASHAAELDDDLHSDVLAALSVNRAAVGIDAVELADEAEATAPRPRAAVAGFVARWTPDLAGERLGRARALLQRSRGRPVSEATALHLLRCALMERHHVEEAAAVSARFSAAVQDRGDGDLILIDLWARSALALAEGRYDDSRALADQAVRSAPAACPAAADVIRVSRQTVEGIIAWHERRLGDVVPEVVDLAATVDPDWLTVVALAHAQAGRHQECLRAADRVLEQPGGGVRAPVHTILLADAYVELGDAERAASLLPTLESYGDTSVVLWPGLTFLGPAALYRGAVKAVLELPDAEDELRYAAEVSRRFGFAPFQRRAERLLGL